ncbi:MAG: mechanosensitive ion channel [Clostridia bacterium]|nr:mechanosensitive ion channel [Clostridia bacterium]
MLLGVFDGFNTFFETVGVQIIKCIAVFVIGVIAIRIIKAVIKKTTSKSKNQTLINFFVSILTVALYVVIFYIIFAILGISTASFIAAISAAGLAIALSLKDSLSNLANGVLIVSTKPFVEGDYISIAGVEGTVKSVEMFTTKIVTVDNKEITIPNSQIIADEIVNYSVRTTRRVDLDVYVAYGSDIEKVKRVLLDVMNKHDMIAKNPAPFARLNKYGDSALIFRTKAWTSNENYWTCYHDLLEQFAVALKENGIKVPLNTQEVYVTTVKQNDCINEVVNDN